MGNDAKNLPRVGIVGLGQIGGGVAICLARKGYDLSVYDIRPDAADTLGIQCRIIETPLRLAMETDIVLIAVLDGTQVLDVMSGPEGLLAGVHDRTVLVVLSTVTMKELEEMIAAASRVDVDLLDCGVTGGAMAEEGGMSCMVGGDDEVVSRIRSVLEDFTAEVHHMGPLGTGMATKIARNLVHFCVWHAGVEGARLAKQAGVDIGKFIALVESAAKKDGASVTVWMDPDRVKGRGRMPTDPQELRRQTLLLQRKDLLAARELATALGVDIPAAEVALEQGPFTYQVDE